MTTRRNRTATSAVVAICAALALAQSNSAAEAQTFPAQPLRIVVGSAPSTPPDILSRVIASELQDAEKWTVVVENRPGASQVLGGQEVLRAAADGHTLYNVSLPITAAPALQSKITFDLMKDFAPVIQLARSYNVLVVHPAVPATSLAELVKLLKDQPDKLNYSSGGLGTPAHLVGELFRQQAQVRAAHVPYVQFPQAISDLLNGTNHYMFITTLPVMDLIASGKLRALAVTSPQRLPTLKDVPTVGEQGFAGLTVGDWNGMLVRAGTPGASTTRLNQAMNKALQSAKVREAFGRLAAEPVGGPPETFGTLLAAELAQWGKVIAAAGLKPQ